MSDLRTIARVRQALPHVLAEAFLPLEQHADATAIAALRFSADMLEQRIAARLGVADGHPLMTLIHEGCQHAFAAQSKFREAHAMAPQMFEDLGLVYAPACPGVEDTNEPPMLRSVA